MKGLTFECEWRDLSGAGPPPANTVVLLYMRATNGEPVTAAWGGLMTAYWDGKQFTAAALGAKTPLPDGVEVGWWAVVPAPVVGS